MLVLVALRSRPGRVGRSIWAELLQSLGLRGDEHIIDLGCGRGAVLMLAAKVLPHGQAVGVDVWKSSDQSGNDVEATRRNAELEEVAERVQLETADNARVAFRRCLVRSRCDSLAIHNISSAEGRAAAIEDAVRVVRRGGRLAIADIKFAREYVRRLRQLGLNDVKEKNLGPRFWYGGPWMATKLVMCVKPR